MYDNNKSIFEYAKEISNEKMMCFYDAYKVLLKDIDCIVCLESASDLQGFSNGGFRNNIYVYSTENIDKPYLKCFIVDSLDNIPFVNHKNIKVTPIENTINDMLARKETDDQILFETFANYYFTNNCSYNKLKIPKQLEKKARIYEEGGKNYYET